MNETPKAVVVATDGSPSAAAAVLWAAEEAARSGHPLHIVHIQEPWNLGLPAIPPPEADAERAVCSRQLLEEARLAAEKHSPDLTVTTENIVGETVLRLRDVGGTQLVLGSRGRSRFAGLLLGSTSLRVAGNADRPVVVVRGENTSARHGVVIVGIDPAEVSERALAYAFEAARYRGARLRAICVWDIADTFLPYLEEPDSTAYSSDPDIIDPQDRFARALAHWKVRYPDVKVVEETAMDEPVAALSEATSAADLLVVGSHGRNPLAGLLLGSVTHGLLHHAHCPVAVIPRH